MNNSYINLPSYHNKSDAYYQTSSQKSTLNPEYSQSVPKVIEVFSHNFEAEIEKIASLVEEYNYIAMVS